MMPSDEHRRDHRRRTATTPPQNPPIIQKTIDAICSRANDHENDVIAASV